MKEYQKQVYLLNGSVIAEIIIKDAITVMGRKSDQRIDGKRFNTANFWQAGEMNNDQLKIAFEKANEWASKRLYIINAEI